MVATVANKETLLHEGSGGEVLAPPAETKKTFLFDRLGGEEAVNACVDIFYDRIVADEGLKKFYDGKTVARLRNHQKKFLKLVFTEIPADMDVGNYLLVKHERLFQDLDLSEVHFDMIAGHLVAALRQLNVPENLVDEVVGIVGPLRAVFENEAKRIREERMDTKL